MPLFEKPLEKSRGFLLLYTFLLSPLRGYKYVIPSGICARPESEANRKNQTQVWSFTSVSLSIFLPVSPPGGGENLKQNEELKQR
jgi:hypothetical protein